LTASPRAIELTVAAAEAAADKLATDPVAIDVSDRLVITDVFLIVSAGNDRQARAIFDAIEEKLLTLRAKPLRREGEREGRWVLLDYNELVVHIQLPEERTYYGLERLWRDCPLIDLPAAAELVAAGTLDDDTLGQVIIPSGLEPETPVESADAQSSAAVGM
jgi:ribosome-associated protein